MFKARAGANLISEEVAQDPAEHQLFALVVANV